jgi:potassium efflux system protein
VVAALLLAASASAIARPPAAEVAGPSAVPAPAEPGAAPAVAAPAAAPDSLDAQLAARRTEIGADPSLDPARREAAQQRLQQAQLRLQSAAADRAEMQRLQAERQSAPAELAALAMATAAGSPDAAGRAEDAAAGTQRPDKPWNERSLVQLEVETSAADGLVQSARARAAEADLQLASLRERRPTLGADLAAAREAAADAALRVAQVATAGPSAAETDSEQLLARANQQAAEARLALLGEQRDGADLREQLLESQLAAAQREVARRETRLQSLLDELSRRRLAETAGQSAAWEGTVVGSYEVVAGIARSNRELAEMCAGPGSITHQLGAVRREAAELERAISEFTGDAAETYARLQGLGSSYAAGVLLSEGIATLPSVAERERHLEQRRVRIGDTEMRIVDLASELRRLERDLPGETAAVLARLEGLPAADHDEAREVVGRLLDARRRIMTPLLRDLDQLRNGLVEMQARERDLVADVEAFGSNLHSRAPWVRNGPRVALVDLPAAFAGLAALPTGATWAGSWDAAVAAVDQEPWKAAWSVVAVAAALAMLVMLRRRRRRASPGSAGAQPASPHMVLVAALLNGAAAVVLATAVGGWIQGIADAPVVLRAVGTTVLHLLPAAFVLGFLPALFAEQGGVASVRPSLEAISRRVRMTLWLLGGVVLLLLASRVLYAVGAAGLVAHGDLGARLCLLIAGLLMAVGAYRATARAPQPAPAADTRLQAVRPVLVRALPFVIPVAFGALLVHGFTLAAYDLARALIGTLLVLVVAGTVRRLFLEPAAAQGRSERWSALRQGRLDLLHVLVVVAAAAGLLFVWADVIRSLEYLQDVPLWTAATVDGLKTVTVANLLSCLAVIGATLLAFWALPLVFGTDSLDSVQRGVGTRYAVVALFRYVVLFVGLAVAFSLLNIGWSKLQWLAAGLSVGLGFGLQETAANFFSGLTLLSERSIRVGDLVTVGDKTGIVTRIKVRATTVRDFDGLEVVIPNKELVTTQVTNWTLTDSKRRLQIRVGVAYESDTRLVVSRLLQAAGEVEGVLRRPAPQAFFEQFGDSVLQFRLYVWIATPQNGTQVNHELHMRIDDLFRESGISIDFPQQDVHLYPKGPLEVRVRGDSNQ